MKLSTKILPLMLLSATAGVSHAETQSADEAAWRQHLKQAHIKDGLQHSGLHESNPVTAGWEVIPGASEDSVVVTSQDVRYLLSAAGNKASQRPARITDLRYQAEVGGELVQLKFFYHF